MASGSVHVSRRVVFLKATKCVPNERLRDYGSGTGRRRPLVLWTKAEWT